MFPESVACEGLRHDQGVDEEWYNVFSHHCLRERVKLTWKVSEELVFVLSRLQSQLAQELTELRRKVSVSEGVSGGCVMRSPYICLYVPHKWLSQHF